MSFSQEYRFERLNEINIADLPYIFRAAFGKEQAVEFFIKKNDTRCFGVSNLGYIAYSAKGEPAAFYGAYPCIVEYQGKHYKAAQIGDAMTHPAHQRKGLFQALAALTHETARQEGISFLFTFPNKSVNSYPGFIKQRWIETGGWQSYVIRVRGISHQMFGKSGPVRKRIYAKYCRFVLGFSDTQRISFRNSVIDEFTGGVSRSEAFLKYKSYTPNFCLRINNKIVWVSIRGNTLLIGDIEQCSSAEFKSVIRRLKLLARILGLGYIEFKCSAGIYMEKFFDSVKSWKTDNTQTAILYFNLDSTFPAHAIKFTIADDDTF